MSLYEHVFLVRQEASPQQVEALIERFKAIISEGSGSVGKVESWGLKPCAYRIRKNRKAHYVLMNIDAPHAAVAEMERIMGLNSDVIRFMTLKVESHSDKPSIMMKAREERTERRPAAGQRPSRNNQSGDIPQNNPEGDKA